MTPPWRCCTCTQHGMCKKKNHGWSDGLLGHTVSPGLCNISWVSISSQQLSVKAKPCGLSVMLKMCPVLQCWPVASRHAGPVCNVPGAWRHASRQVHLSWKLACFVVVVDHGAVCQCKSSQHQLWQWGCLLGRGSWVFLCYWQSVPGLLDMMQTRLTKADMKQCMCFVCVCV